MRDSELWRTVCHPLPGSEPHSVKRRRFYRRVYWTLALLIVVGCGLFGLSN